MAFKFICVVFLLSVAFLSVQAKNTKKHEKQHGKLRWTGSRKPRGREEGRAGVEGGSTIACNMRDGS